MRTAILDDEPLAIELLKDYVEKTPQLTLAYADSDPFLLLEKIEAGEIDLVLLDIQMPALNGIQFLKIAKNKCNFIITTAYTEYAIDGYEYHVVDYLLKPISYDRFHTAVQKVESLKNYNSNKLSKKSIDHNYLFVKSGYKNVKIDLKDIMYIKSASDYVEFYLINQNKVLSLDTIKHLKIKLEKYNFIQIHRSYILNFAHIKFTEGNSIVLMDGTRLPIGEIYKQEFLNRIQLL